MQMLAGKKMQLHTIIKVALRALMYRERFDNKTETFLKSYSWILKTLRFYESFRWNLGEWNNLDLHYEITPEFKGKIKKALATLRAGWLAKLSQAPLHSDVFFPLMCFINSLLKKLQRGVWDDYTIYKLLIMCSLNLKLTVFPKLVSSLEYCPS